MLTKVNPAQNRSAGLRLTRQWLLLILMGLAIATAYLFYRQQPHYRLQVFSTPAGWGYTILANGNPMIYQPTVPGVAGSHGFTSQDQARRVGDQVILKLQHGQKLPTLTHDELRRLGVAVR